MAIVRRALEAPLRTLSDNAGLEGSIVVQKVLDGIREVTIATCRAMGSERDPEVTIRESEYTPATYNDPELTRWAIPTLERAGGRDRVVEGVPITGAEDFAFYQEEVPGFFFAAVGGSGDESARGGLPESELSGKLTTAGPTRPHALELSPVGADECPPRFLPRDR